ncbi:MAG: hypothetical protein ABJE66_14575 [Deltaproteobacteria bacterium]
MSKTLAIALLAVAAASSGCKKADESRIADKASCAAITRSISVNKILIGGVTRYLSDADSAAAEADRWKKKEITDVEDGTGEFSGAANRALLYAGSALSLCESVRQVHSGIESIAHTIHEPSIHVGERPLQLDCFDETRVGTQDSDAATKWEGERAAVQLAESRYLDACKAAFGADDGHVDGWPLGLIHERANKQPKQPSP